MSASIGGKVPQSLLSRLNSKASASAGVVLSAHPQACCSWPRAGSYCSYGRARRLRRPAALKLAADARGKIARARRPGRSRIPTTPHAYRYVPLGLRRLADACPAVSFLMISVGQRNGHGRGAPWSGPPYGSSAAPASTWAGDITEKLILRRQLNDSPPDCSNHSLIMPGHISSMSGFGLRDRY